MRGMPHQRIEIFGEGPKFPPVDERATDTVSPAAGASVNLASPYLT